MIPTYTTSEVGRMCGVDPSTVVRWIRSGHLEAYATPGGHRRIRADRLRRFLKKYNMPVPPDLDEFGPLRVLVVDDDEAVLEVVSRAMQLEDPNLLIETAADGYEACVKAGNFKPDLVMLDAVNLPEKAPASVCSAIQSNPELSHTRIIAITGLPDDDRVQAVLDAGAEQCLAKPLHVDALRALVRETMAK